MTEQPTQKEVQAAIQKAMKEIAESCDKIRGHKVENPFESFFGKATK